MKLDDPILTFLSDEQILDEAVLEALVAKRDDTGQSLLSILKQEKLVDETLFTQLVAKANGIEFVDVSAGKIDPMVAHLISRDLAHRHNAIPWKREGNTLVVAMGSPLDLAARNEIEIKTGYSVTPVAAAPASIRQAVKRHFDEADVTKQVVASMRLKDDRVTQLEDAGKRARLQENVDDPISKLVSSIIKGAISARASDIHIEPQAFDVRVRYRVDGTLRDTVRVPISVLQEVVSHIKILADMDISEHRMPQDGHATIWHEDAEYDLRVSSLPAVGGEKIVFRILDKRVERWAFDKVISSPQDNRVFRELVGNPYGMFLVTGPTGSGKTTTLYSVLQLVNTPEKNIVTVEDPVEYRLGGITQVQVKPIAGMTFPSALRSILRQDPDIILIGEIRDRETAEIAIGAALTGHLVLSTLHTNDAAGAVSRLVNLGIPPFLVGSALLGVAAQRLVKRCCPQCKASTSASEAEARILSKEVDGTGGFEIWRGDGCRHCYSSGYAGRMSIYEILAVSRQMQRMIVEGSDDDAIKRQAMSEGMRTLRKAATDAILEGCTTVEEMLRVVDVERG